MIHKSSVKREIEAQVSIGRAYSGSEERSFISLTVEDKKSGNQVVYVKMSLEQFAQAITGQIVKAESGVAYVTDIVGKVQQVETVLVPMLEDTWGADHWARFKDNCKVYCASKFPDWIMDEIGDRNHHKVKKLKAGKDGVRPDDCYEVVVRRWI